VKEFYGKKSTVVSVIVLIISFFLLIVFLINLKAINVENNLIAKVNDIGISKIVFEKQVKESLNFLEWQKQDVNNLKLIRKDILNKLINESIINQYAVKNKIRVSENEINVRYQLVVEGYNKRNKLLEKGDIAFLAKLKEMYDIKKSDYLLALREDILREKIQIGIKKSFAQWVIEQRKSANIKYFDI
jgi:hypothetical protein